MGIHCEECSNIYLGSCRYITLSRKNLNRMEHSKEFKDTEQELRIEKEYLEIEVLRRSLRPPYRQATIVLSVLGVLAAFIGMTVQWRDAIKDVEIARLLGA